MRCALRLSLGCWLAFGAGCAHRVSHIAPDESQPHISWDLRTGGDLGDATVVCASTQPAPTCLLEATTEGRRSPVTVHLSLHAAAGQTSYVGAISVPFIQGAGQGGTNQVKATIEVGSPPVSSTISGLVTRQPGNYTLSISLNAVQASRPEPQRIVAEARVTVR